MGDQRNKQDAERHEKRHDKRHDKRHIKLQAGISLIDLVIGLAIGLLAMLVILKLAILFESRRRSTTGMADAQLNAASAIMLMARELRMAGQGLGPPDGLGCNVSHGLNNLGALSLQPLQIIDGADGLPDRLRVLMSGSSLIISPATLIADHDVSADNLMIDSSLGMSVGDHLLLYEAGKSCLLLKATSLPIGAYQVNHEPSSKLAATTYLAGARVINLGGLHYVEFSIDSRRYLNVARYSAVADQWQSAAMASEVVNLQAQYGFDTRPDNSANPSVTWWSSSMIDADGNQRIGDNGDLRRLIAIRLAIVVRSAERSDQGCTATVPQWLAGDDAQGMLTPTDIRVDHLSDWQCYRYRVLQTEIPLRNLLWSDA